MSRPTFTQFLKGTVASAGQPVRFDTRITGSKPIDVSWLKDGKKIQSDSHYKIIEDDTLHSLLINEAVPGDGGKYECIATSAAGGAKCECQLIVQGAKGTVVGGVPGSGDVQPPAIVEPIKGQVVKEGQPVIFRCKVTGKPAPEIKWQKGNQLIQPSKYFQLEKQGDVYSLIISGEFPDVEGEYKLIAASPVGSVGCSAKVVVQH